MKPLRFLPEAEAEFLHEVEYYSALRTGTGLRFEAAVEAAVLRARHHPSGGAPADFGTRCMLIRGFPFSVIYRATDAEILVVALAAHRREAGYWMHRLVKPR